MDASFQEILTAEQTKALLSGISAERLGTYRIAAGHDENRALRLYMWNVQIGEAFHVPIQAVEVGLRNAIGGALASEYGVEWWRSEKFDGQLDNERKADLAQVLRRIRNRNLMLSTGQVIAGLSFGFWVGMLQPRYNPPLWSRHLRSAFSYLPQNRNRKSLALRAGAIATLRNRIWHHEPLIKRDISRDYADVMEFLEWINPTKMLWVRPYCRVPELMRKKP